MGLNLCLDSGKTHNKTGKPQETDAIMAHFESKRLNCEIFTACKDLAPVLILKSC